MASSLTTNHLSMMDLLSIISIVSVVVHGQGVLKSEILTPSNHWTNGAMLISHFGEVQDLASNEWRVDIASQSSWQFILILDSTWGFSSSDKSAIEIQIASPSIATGPDTFDDIVFGFTTGNNEYFTTWLPMDNNGQKNRIFPECDQTWPPSQTYAVGDVATLPNTDRNCDVAGGSCANWRTMWPKNAQAPNVYEFNGFPITFTLENDPRNNIMNFYFHTASFSFGFIQRCGFVAMTPESGLKFYIGGNDPGQSFIISSIQVQSIGYTWSPTMSPTTARPTTASPTNQPSVSPTKNPTNNPTKSPTNNPTKSPTPAPTDNPTPSPTPSPTSNPTNAPSYSPSKAPTPAPTENPTPAPTGDPTRAPSHAPTSPPTNAPTKPPTAAPTHNPTSAPSAAPSYSPSKAPTPAPTSDPTGAPTYSPSAAPSKAPTSPPTTAPSNAPSSAPSNAPTSPPSAAPSLAPTSTPTEAPTKTPSAAPSNAPSAPPTNAPSYSPSLAPTLAPTESPTNAPTMEPTIDPTADPTSDPTLDPTLDPTTDPTIDPTQEPTTAQPTESPITRAPTTEPTFQPTWNPTTDPTYDPTDNPTEHCPWPKPCHARKTELCCELSDECQWAAASYAACQNGNHPSISCCINTPMPTPFPTQRPSTGNPSISPSTNPTTASPSTNPTPKPVTVVRENGTNPNPGGSNPEVGAGAEAQDAFGDLILPVILVVVVGACALCCVIIVIARQICYNRKRNRASFDDSKSPSDDSKMNKKKKNKKGKGHYSHAYTQSIEMGGVDALDEADGHRKGTGDNHHKHKRSGSQRNRRGTGDRRSRNDVIDGQILTVPMRDGRGNGTNRQHTNSFNRNIANIASGNNVLMDDVVEQIGNGTSFGMPRKDNYGALVGDGGLAGIAPRSKSTNKRDHENESIHSDSGHSEDDLSQEPDVDPSPTDSEQKQNMTRSHLHPFGRDRDDESDDIRNERPEMHNYSTNLMALAPTSIISESEQKSTHPPAHESRNVNKQKSVSLGPKGPMGGYHDITGSQFGKLQRAINNAKTASDFEKLEEIIKSGQIPEQDWHGKGSRYNNSHGGGINGNNGNSNNSFKGMVQRAFDPNTVITSQAMSESEDHIDHGFIYKMNSQISNTSISTFGHGHSHHGHQSRPNKLPNMGNTDSVATVDSIGVKMPQYRRHGMGNNSNKSHNKRKNNDNTEIITAEVKGNLDNNELMNKLAGLQKEDKKKIGNNKRGREKKYLRGDSSSTATTQYSVNNDLI